MPYHMLALIIAFDRATVDLQSLCKIAFSAIGSRTRYDRPTLAAAGLLVHLERIFNSSDVGLIITFVTFFTRRFDF